MNPVKLYLLHFANINKLYDIGFVDRKEELASRVPYCGTLKNRYLLNVLWWIVVITEPFLSLIIITIKLPVFLAKVITRNTSKNVGKHIGLCYSGLAKQRIKIVDDVYETIDYYLYPIGVEKIWVMPDKEQHCVLEQVNAIEVIKAYLWTCVAIIIANIKTHGKYLYRNHVCFEYLLTNYFLHRISSDCSLYFVNHLDRWAVLFNYAPQKEKILLQHGIEGPNADWPVKLLNVKKAYVFADSQRERLTKAVLGHIPEFEVMPPTISLTDMQTAKGKNIVIVACENYIFYENEEYIIKRINNENLRIFVKIHPGKNDYQKYVTLQKIVNPNIEIITTPTFPRVNLVVSYYSTLGIEYEAHRIPVLYYDEITLDDIVNRINAL